MFCIQRFEFWSHKNYVAGINIMDSQLSKSEREMLKAVYRLTKGGSDAHTGALAEHLGISPGTVTATVKRLAERGMVDHRPYKGVEVTKAGRQAAVSAIRRHRIVERFLSDMLGYAWNEADRLAGAFEHELPQEIEDRLFEKLGRPATCPHGFPIPDSATDRILQMPSLDELVPGDTGVVALSGSTDQEIVDFLETLGIRPGAHLEVISKQPFDGPIVVRVEGSEATVGERLAEKIFVKSRHLAAANPGRAEIEPVDARNTERVVSLVPDPDPSDEPQSADQSQRATASTTSTKSTPSTKSSQTKTTKPGKSRPVADKRKDIPA
jgi:DtxR family transcriptional regulator, Mn-dependent transcriptional regulator